VDSRIHIFNQYVKRGRTQSMEEIIDATIERYGAVLLRLKCEGYSIWVHSVPATPYQDNIYGVANYADDETRARIVAEFNGRLSAWCSANQVCYLDVYSVVSDERGFIRKELTTDGTHLDESALPIYQDWVSREVLQRKTP
jgi:lysophospholipase L1-like esterase